MLSITGQTKLAHSSRHNRAQTALTPVPSATASGVSDVGKGDDVRKMEFLMALETEGAYDDDVHVACIDIETGETYEVVAVEYENVQPSTGATMWLKIDRN